jgi:lipid-binding SYLF domain-containing protein
MKKNHLTNTVARSLVIFFALCIAYAATAQSSKDKKIIEDCTNAKAEFIKTDPLLKNVFAAAYGYAIFPNVGKGGLGVGGASGNGMVYEKGNIVGKSKLSQLTIGFQAGGQAYRELIFFENKAALDRFRGNKFEFSAQASAVAATAGASANAKYRDGIMIYTQQKGGVMYEASVGGQKFKFDTF